MTLRFLNRVTSAVTSIPSSIKCHARNPKNIIQLRKMSKKQKDGGTRKQESCGGGDSRFFRGCFKKVETPKCPVPKKKDGRGVCRDPCKDGPCKQQKSDD